MSKTQFWYYNPQSAML